MNVEPLELSDRDGDALAVQIDDAGIWVTCTNVDQEVTVGPFTGELLESWLAAART